MKLNVLIGGKAGQGPNVLADIVSYGLISKGFHVFYARDYQSLIRGGHNFNTVSFSDEPVHSNSKPIDILVCLDEKTKDIHKQNLAKNSIILEMQSGKTNMFFAGELFKILGLDFKLLEKELRKLKNYESNIKQAKDGYEKETRKLEIVFKTASGKISDTSFMNGSQAIADSAVKSGLEFYYAYPMTPATPVMMELGQMMKNKENKHIVIELENETAVMNAGLGSALTGAKSMCGTSGGGFDLMTEALSMAGMADIPIVVYLSQRPGPSTGVPTYTGQGDLKVALAGGHGEFVRVVSAPGDIIECMENTSEAFYLSQKFRIPVILLADKHLGESKFSFSESANLMKSEKSIKELERFNSYESDEHKIASENPEIAKKNADERARKAKIVAKEIENKIKTFKTYGNLKGKKLILSWGSTKGAILDILNHHEVDAKFIQIIYLEPFSEKLAQEIKKYDVSNVFIVENNATSPLSALIAEKTGIIIPEKNRILKYDGRPFFSDELALELKKKLGGK